MPDISFVILSWNSKKYIGKCFDSIMSMCERHYVTYEIIVIDNGSKDNPQPLYEYFDFMKSGMFHFIYLDANKGTTFPRNLGLRRAQGTYICIIDSDTEMLVGDIRMILTALEADSELGIVAPKLVLDNGAVQESIKKFPTFCHKLLKLPKAIFNINMSNLDFYDVFPFSHQMDVDSAISACWFFRRDLVDLVGYFDENIFYSPEDLDFCLRVRKAGKKIRYFPDVTVLHHTQQISHKKPFSRISLSHFWGLVYYFRKHGGWFSSPAV